MAALGRTQSFIANTGVSAASSTNRMTEKSRGMAQTSIETIFRITR